MSGEKDDSKLSLASSLPLSVDPPAMVPSEIKISFGGLESSAVVCSEETRDREKEKEKGDVNPTDNLQKSTSGGQFYMFPNQVAGHMPIISRQKGILSKPAQADEVKFYENLQYGKITVNESFKEFIPKFYGCCYVDLDMLLEKGIKSRDGSTSYGGHGSSSNGGVAESPVTTRATPNETEGGESDTENSKPLSRRLWKRFKNERVQSKRLEFDEFGRCKYILLQDLTGDYESPCILDIKIGTRQYADDDSPDKIARKIAKCKKTTSASLGMRICGMQVYQRLSSNEKTTETGTMSSSMNPSGIMEPPSLHPILTTASSGGSSSPGGHKRSRADSIPSIVLRKEKSWGQVGSVKFNTACFSQFISSF
jgi:hypothetical protein